MVEVICMTDNCCPEVSEPATITSAQGRAHNTGDKTLSRYIKYSGFTVTYSVVRWHTITGSDVYASACGYVFLLSRV